jgi:hypothetical protein
MNRKLMDAVLADQALLKDRGLHRADQHVLLALARGADANGKCLSLGEPIMAYTGLRASSIEFSLQGLKEEGFIDRPSGTVEVTIHHAVDPDDPERLILQPRYPDPGYSEEVAHAVARGADARRRRLYSTDYFEDDDSNEPLRPRSPDDLG